MNDIAERMERDFGEFLPDLLTAIAVLIVGWLIAWIVSKAVKSLLKRTSIDDKIARWMAGDEGGDPPRTEDLVAKIIFWILMILVFVAVFQILGLGLVARPIDGAISEIFGYLPNLLSAALLAVVAWLVARVVRSIVTIGAQKANLDEKVAGDEPPAGAVRAEVAEPPTTRRTPKLSKTLGETGYWLVLLLFLPAILDALAIESITRPASEMVDQVMTAIPRLFAAAILVAIAYFVGKVLAGFISNILSAAGFDRVLDKIGLTREGVQTATRPSALIGKLVMIILIVFAVIEALELIGFDMLSAMITELAMFAGDVLLGVVVFGVGLYLARLAADAIESSGAQNADVLATAAKVGIIVLAGAMALRQAGIGDDIILLAFGLTLGAAAVAAAIAFGIGGREIAKERLEKWVNKAESEPKRLPPV